MARRMTSPVLVGRAEALEQFEAAFSLARAGEPRHIVVGGEAGVGKTRLLLRAQELAEQQGMRVVTGACVAMGETGLPFAPYAAIVRSLAAQGRSAGRCLRRSCSGGPGSSGAGTQP